MRHSDVMRGLQGLGLGAWRPPDAYTGVVAPSTSIRLELGSSGPDVVEVQSILKARGFLPSYFLLTGKYDLATRTAVLAYQKHYGITEAAGQGNVGGVTWDFMHGSDTRTVTVLDASRLRAVVRGGIDAAAANYTAPLPDSKPTSGGVVLDASGVRSVVKGGFETAAVNQVEADAAAADKAEADDAAARAKAEVDRLKAELEEMGVRARAAADLAEAERVAAAKARLQSELALAKTAFDARAQRAESLETTTQKLWRAVVWAAVPGALAGFAYYKGYKKAAMGLGAVAAGAGLYRFTRAPSAAAMLQRSNTAPHGAHSEET